MIRRATIQDLNVISGFIKQIYITTYNIDLLNNVADWLPQLCLDEDRAEFIVLEYDNMIKGFMIGWYQESEFYFPTQPYYYIFLHYVDSQNMDDDFLMLMQHFEYLAKEKHTKTIQIDIYLESIHSKSFIDSLGYKCFRSRYVKDLSKGTKQYQNKAKYELKRASNEDEKVLEEMWKEFFDSLYIGEFFDDDVKTDLFIERPYKNNLHNENAVIKIFTDGNQCGGFIEADIRNSDLHYFFGNYAYIMSYYLRPEFRSHKIAALMLSDVGNWAETKGLRYICADIFSVNQRVDRSISYVGYKKFKTRYVKKLFY